LLLTKLVYWNLRTKKLSASLDASTLEVYRLKSALAKKEAELQERGTILAEQHERITKRSYGYTSPSLGNFSVQLEHLSFRYMIQLLDFKFFGSSKIEISSDDPPLVLCVYLLLSAFCGWYLWTCGSVLGLSIMETLGWIELLNGLIFAYASYQIHRHGNEMIISCSTLFVIFLIYWMGIWGRGILFGGLIHCMIILSYFHWKKHYPHLDKFTDIIKAIYYRQANAAHIL